MTVDGETNLDPPTRTCIIKTCVIAFKTQRNYTLLLQKFNNLTVHNTLTEDL